MLSPDDYAALPPDRKEEELGRLLARLNLETYWHKSHAGQVQRWRIRTALPVPRDDHFTHLLTRFKDTAAEGLTYSTTGPATRLPTYRQAWCFAMGRCSCCEEEMEYYHSDKYVTYGCPRSDVYEGHDFHPIIRYDHP